MPSANGLGRAATRRISNNTPTHGAGAGGDALATAIGQQVAMNLAPFIAQLAQQLAAQAQKIACCYCAARRKIAEHQHLLAVAALRHEYEIACKAAAELGDAAPEWAEPGAPELPAVQEAFTWVPVQPAPGAPPTSVPVCYDDLPTEPAGPVERPTGLVTADGRPVVARG